MADTYHTIASAAEAVFKEKMSKLLAFARPVVVVVRYFGGIKLGTSGLIAAYRQAARLALEEAGRLECHAMETVEFSFPYIAMNGVMKAVKVSGAQITSQTFDNLCSMTLSIRADDAGRLHSMLADVEGLCFS